MPLPQPHLLTRSTRLRRLLEVNLDPSLQTGDLIGTPAGANARLKAGMLVDLFNLVGISPPPPPPQTDATAAAAAAAGARRLTTAEAKDAALRHVNAEYRRSQHGGWRRLLPSKESTVYAPFFGAERRELNILPFDI